MPVSLEGLLAPHDRVVFASAGPEAVETESHLRLPDYLRRQRVFGRIFAGILLIPVAPLIGVLVLLIRLTSPGPGLFRQCRVGLHGRVVYISKLRTMRVDAEDECGPAWAARCDPRITWLGRILRKLHLDELPQLWNVVRGEMALIGPRPERPEFVHQLAIKIPNYLDRLSILPGITGLAQIRLPPDCSLESVRLKLQQDLEYIQSANPWLDFRILGCTALRVTGIPGQWAARAFRLNCTTANAATSCDHSYTPLKTLNGTAGAGDESFLIRKHRKPR